MIKIRIGIVSRYVLCEHVGPFLFGMIAIIFLFLLNVVFRDMGKLLGKGLPVDVVLEFFVLNLAWIVALAIPMAVLVATLMAFGRLSSDNEIIALKASGVHLYQMIAPVLVVSIILAVGVERFHNSVLPEFNHRYRLLFSDISKKRPTLTLESNVFFDEIPNYSLLVHDLKEDKEWNLLKGIIINDYSDPEYSKTVIAEQGQLTFSEEREEMIFTLFNVEVHSVELKNLENYRRIKSRQWILSIPVPDMILKRSNSQQRGDREKNVKMMREDIEKNLLNINQREERIRQTVRLDLE
ncbi:LptF/LptG family permease, partial [bacterium]|nr:LptF/LptG family permease [bacterium]